MDIKIFLMDKGLLANSYQTFVMIFRFCLLSKPPTSLLTNNTTSRWIEYQQKSNEECMPFLLCDIPEQKNKQTGWGEGGGLRTYFFEPSSPPPWIFHFLTLFLEIRDKFVFYQIPTKFQGQKLRPLWKFHIIFSSPLEIPLHF